MPPLLPPWVFVGIVLWAGPWGPRPAAAQDGVLGYHGWSASATGGAIGVTAEAPSSLGTSGPEFVVSVELGPRLLVGPVFVVPSGGFALTDFAGIDNGDAFAFSELGVGVEVGPRDALGPVYPSLRLSANRHSAEVAEGPAFTNLSGSGRAIEASLAVDPQALFGRSARADRDPLATHRLEISAAWLQGHFDTAEDMRIETPRDIDHRGWRVAVGWKGPFNLVWRRR